MARNQIVIDSDSDELPSRASTSGAVTPSTAATSRALSLNGTDGARVEATNESEDDSEPVGPAKSKGKSSTRASSRAGPGSSARKIPDISLLSDSDNPTEGMEIDELDDDERVKSTTTTVKGKLTRRGSSIVNSLGEEGTEGKLAKKVQATRKKKVVLAEESRASSVASSSSKKVTKPKGGKGDIKGKGKAALFEDESTDEDEVALQFEAEMLALGKLGQIIADADSAEEEKDELEEESEEEEDEKDLPLGPDGKPKQRPRKGAKITAEMKKGWKKMSKYEKSQVHLHANHPELVNCWETLAASTVSVAVKAVQPKGFSLKLLPFQQEGLDWMMKQEAGSWHGGMLADEMGMGKTAQTIALILSDYKKEERQPTLVLAPTVAIIQWKTEIEKFTEGFKILVWHGSNRIDSVAEMSKHDVVLTSYAVMESSFRREIKGFMKKGVLMKEDSIIHKLDWHRIILDEAHNIKDRSSNQAKAAFSLKGQFRWCLSGTPLQNRVGELYSLIRFIGVDPFAYYYCKQCHCKSLHWLSVMGPCKECRHSGMQHVCYWNNEILKPIQYGGTSSGEGQKAFKKLTTLLERLMLRRTKVERADDMGLPPRVVNVRRDFFTEEEEELYKSLYQDVNRKFNTYADEGTVLNNYSNIFTLITRMRQMADHPDLCLKSRTAMPVDHAAADVPSDLLICKICHDEAEDAIISACKHVFCRTCVRQYLEMAVEMSPQCPSCSIHITIDLFQDPIEREEDTEGAMPKQGFLSRIDPSKYRTSTKIEALVEELSKLRTEDSTLKSLVFSQFTTMLDLVERRLKLGGFKTVRLSGTMTPIARHNIIQKFTNDPDVAVFLISLKAGGVALNLTEASRVFLLDPWWNPAVELQAMDRIHRIGQHRPVVVTRLIIENSIESRILELQRKKEAMTSSTLGDDDSGLGRLTPEDLQFLFSL